MAIGSQQDQQRKKMLAALSRSGALQGNKKQMTHAMGYRKGKQAVAPDSNRPNMTTSPDTFAKWAQTALRGMLGITLKIDGNIGPVTRAAIKQFQRREGLTAHGYLDERTIQAIELRTGVKAPRGFSHEAVPHLLLVPRRGLWRPGKNKPKNKAKAGKDGAKDAAQPDAEVSPMAAAGEQAAEKAAAQPAKAGLLQDEAMSAVAEQAFANDFAQLAADRLGREDWQQVQTQMGAWWKAQSALPAQEQERWVQLASDEARARDERSSSRLRRRWWSQHVDGDS
ncbi:MAG: peptidoglycan-binding protein [Myxococcales bacterium]|nr:peptidoglycan-binding protein [Myxococcales bacterium]